MYFSKIQTMKDVRKVYHKDLEKREGLFGGRGVVVHESHVQQKGDCFLGETLPHIFPLFKILMVESSQIWIIHTIVIY